MPFKSRKSPKVRWRTKTVVKNRTRIVKVKAARRRGGGVLALSPFKTGGGFIASAKRSALPVALAVVGTVGGAMAAKAAFNYVAGKGLTPGKAALVVGLAAVGAGLAAHRYGGKTVKTFITFAGVGAATDATMRGTATLREAGRIPGAPRAGTGIVAGNPEHGARVPARRFTFDAIAVRN